VLLSLATGSAMEPAEMTRTFWRGHFKKTRQHFDLPGNRRTPNKINQFTGQSRMRMEYLQLNGTPR
jgi:hypothetical protein